jgi:hypothetical protein
LVSLKGLNGLLFNNATNAILWSKDGQTTAKNKRASLHQIDWHVATEGAQPA